MRPTGKVFVRDGISDGPGTELPCVAGYPPGVTFIWIRDGQECRITVQLADFDRGLRIVDESRRVHFLAVRPLSSNSLEVDSVDMK